MPGRLMPDPQGLDVSQDVKMDQSSTEHGDAHAPMGVDSRKYSPQDDTSLNHEPKLNGLSKSAVPQPLVNGVPPPELDQSWRETPQNKSMATLLDRLAYHAYWELNEAITKMAELPKPPQTSHANGASVTTLDSSSESIERKRIILKYAKEQRDRFTKALVLSDWSRNERDMARLIDIKQWQDTQRWAHANAKHGIGQIKRETVNARMPNPNIYGAMELMATSRACWVPDLGYIPQRRLTPKQLLRMLRNMNVVLSTRLNLHEELPSQMKSFKVANGRASFTVPEEFEVDLSVAEEDPASPFYFIDVRFLFAPSAGLVHEALRGFLEGKVNEQLASDGLKGCYDFLHNFVLTHKINTLRMQAAELAREQWSGCLTSESPRRSLVIRYWADRPGPKSWIEVGIDSGRSRASSPRNASTTPHISIKWYQRGSLVNTDGLLFDWAELSLEKTLERIIRKHTRTVLKDVKARLAAEARDSTAFQVMLTGRDDDSGESTLQINLSTLRAALTIAIDAVTGRWSISPPTAATLNTERRLNSDPTLDVAKWLAALVCSAAQELLIRQAELTDWTPVLNLARQNLSSLFGADTRQRSVFTCPGWGKRFAMAVTFGLQGRKWWVVSLEEKMDPRTNSTACFIRNRREVDSGCGSSAALSKELLLDIERRAVAEISLGVLSQELRTRRVPHQLEQAVETTLEIRKTDRAEVPRSVSIFIRFPHLMKSKHRKNWSPWAAEIIRLTHSGIESSEAENDDMATVRHDVRVSLLGGKMKQLQHHLTKRPDQDIQVNENGALALRLRTPFGQPFLEDLRARLQSVERLDRYITILQKVAFRCNTIGLTRVAFSYGTAHGLEAQVSFTGAQKRPAKLKLLPVTNPHLRIRGLLEEELNGPTPQSFEKTVFIMWATLPAMATFDKLQSSAEWNACPRIRTRALSRYILEYQAPRPRITLQITLRKKAVGGKLQTSWFVQNMTNPELSSAFPDDFKTAMRDLWGARGEGWEGLKNSILAEPRGISEALEKIDAIVRRHEAHEAPLTTSADSAPPVTADPLSQPPAKSASATTGASRDPPGRQSAFPNAITLD